MNINITLGFQLLMLSVGVESTLNASFTGLLGNNNRIPEDDFIFPNGTMLPANSTERQLFEYGKSCECP